MPQLAYIEQDPQLYLIVHCTWKYFHSHNLPLLSMDKKDIDYCLKPDSILLYICDNIIM